VLHTLLLKNQATTKMGEDYLRRRKNKKLAIIAVCNKLLKQVFGVVQSGVLYQDNFCKKTA
jgi:transposase